MFVRATYPDYDGLDGKRATEAVNAMEAILDEFGTGIGYKEVN